MHGPYTFLVLYQHTVHVQYDTSAKTLFRGQSLWSLLRFAVKL